MAATSTLRSSAFLKPSALVKPPTLHYIRAGGGEPLLLLHSLGGDSGIWAPVTKLLTPHFDLIAVDLPGFGASEPLPPEVEPTPRNLARAVSSFVEDLDLGEHPHVAGISLGAWVAIELARLGHASSVTALCAAGFWRVRSAPSWNLSHLAARTFGRLAPALMGSAHARRLALARQMRHPERLSRRQASALVRAYGRSVGYPRTRELMRSNSIGELSELGVPLTLAWADHDSLVRRSPVRALPASVRQVVLPDCGHVPTWDAPELVARLIRETTTTAA